jgi:hypothetical protein
MPRLISPTLAMPRVQQHASSIYFVKTQKNRMQYGVYQNLLNVWWTANHRVDQALTREPFWLSQRFHQTKSIAYCCERWQSWWFRYIIGSKRVWSPASYMTPSPGRASWSSSDSCLRLRIDSFVRGEAPTPHEVFHHFVKGRKWIFGNVGCSKDSGCEEVKI